MKLEDYIKFTLILLKGLEIYPILKGFWKRKDELTGFFFSFVKYVGLNKN